MNSVINQWNNAAENYTISQEQSEYADINKAVVCERFSQLSGEKVLDLGCGYGWYTEYFSSIGGKALGCDGSPKMIDIAKSKYPDCDFQIADIESTLPYEDSSFDMVFCNQVLMDVEDYGKAMSEAYRVLKKGGVFFFGIVHPAFYDCEWAENENGFKKAKVIERYLSQYSFNNEFWGTTTHYHRTISDYLNTALETGFYLKKLTEPVSYDGVNKS